jgi:TonB family protein
VVAVAILALGGFGVYWFMSRSNSNEPTTAAISTAPSTVAPQPTEAQSPTPQTQPVPTPPRAALAPAASAVIHEEIPSVPLRARETIHGHVRVTVRVTVDKSGTVVSDVLENPGPSKYFARLAGAAASKWKFAPSNNQASRQWLVRFEFSRDGTKAHALPRN